MSLSLPLPAGMVLTQMAIPSPHACRAEIGVCLRTPRGGWSGQPRSCWREVESLLCRGHLKEKTNFWGMGELLGQAEAQVRLCTCSARFCGSLFWTWVLAVSLSPVTGTSVNHSFCFPLRGVPHPSA